MRRPDRGATSLAVLAPLLAALVGGGAAVAATYAVVSAQAPAATPADIGTAGSDGGAGTTGGAPGEIEVPYGSGG